MSWPILRQRAADEGLPLATVVGEALHVVILDALFGQAESAAVAFQGGTCLHLVYGGYRFSEDIDLAGEALDSATALAIVDGARSEIEKLAVQILGHGAHEWRPPRNTASRVQTFWYLFQPSGSPSKTRVKLEFARFPTYSAQPTSVTSPLDLLGRRPLVAALTPEELLAEKVAAVLGRRSVRGRDVFDLWFLDQALDTSLDVELLKQKLADYDVPWRERLAQGRTEQVGAADIRREMERFLPQRHRRQLGPNEYAGIRGVAERVLRRAMQALEAG